MIDGDEPYVVPMNYGYTLEDGELCIYLHGATVGRKIDIMKKNPNGNERTKSCRFSNGSSGITGRT